MTTHPTTTPARRSAAEQARLDTALADLFEQRITFNQTLGLKVVSACHPDPRFRFAMRPELIGHFLHGRLHGGVISATLDAMGGFALMVAIGDKHAEENTAQVLHRFGKMGTIDLRIDYLRPGTGEWFEASAEVTRLGGRIGSTQMRLANDAGTLIATGSAAYVIS
ncbi:MAG: thioesterase family protein [Aquincola sp.]|nr:thioesterase family protein [Aquincola sp.]MDH4289813.1 thioesterase family protein [Aquincola sp.]MDH5330288.1 thioesterase family protein [Aquincola sp.]